VRVRLAALSLTVLLALAGSASASTRILAVGDFGVGGVRERATGQAMEAFEARHPAAYFVTLGDNDYTRSPSEFERNWAEAFGWLRAAGVRAAGVLGNHDYEVGEGSYELATLGMPRRYYTRRVGDVQLFLLDSNRIDAAQTAWLRRKLAASTAAWKIAAFHHPAFSCGLHRGSGEVLDRWSPLFERYGVRLALSGHDHNYQRFAPRRGVTYVLHGGGGAPLYPLVGCLPSYPRLERGQASFGFVSIVAGERRLVVTALDLEGRRVDRVTLER
jgi:tartrate-resistant acid phosphatase type 5